MFSFLKKVKHESRGFNYKPRFYNAEKEAMRERIARHERVSALAERGEESKSRISDHFESYRRGRRKSKGMFSMGSIRIFILFFGLLAFAYFALDRWMPMFLRYLFPNEEF